MKVLSKWRGLIVIGLALIYSVSSRAQIELDPINDVSLMLTRSPEQVPAGGNGVIDVEIGLPDNTHITSREMGFFDVRMNDANGVTWLPVEYPSGVIFEDEEVYQGKVKVSLPFKLADSVKKGSKIDVTGTLGYQICTEVDPLYCTPPVERILAATISVSEAGTQGEAAVAAADAGEPTLSIEERAMKALQSGSLMALIWVFLGGVALSFTPCVYPVIPITIAYIGARSGKSRLHGFALSLVFVLGLGLVYSTLGVVAAATGGVFGLNTQNPWVIGFVTVVFLSMGIGMMGAFEIALPSSLQTKLSSGKRTGYPGALLMGGTTGLIAAPCVGPVLIALLGWVSSTGNLLAGFLYLFVFACGLGVLFVVIGTFAGAMTTLPKAGAWMDSVKKGFGVILIAAAFYFGRSLVPEKLFTLLAGLSILMLGAVLGGYSRLPEDATVGRRVLRAVSGFILLIGAFYSLLSIARFEGFLLPGQAFLGGSINAMSGSTSRSSHEVTVKWIWNDTDLAFSKAVETGKPVIIDFWADWCAACRELDHKTFGKLEVYDYINANFIALKVDGSDITDRVKATWEKYKVRGLPTVLFMSPDGTETGRFEAFRTAEQVMPLLKQHSR